MWSTLIRNGEALVYVNVDGTYVSVNSVRYDPGTMDHPPRIILGLDRFELLMTLENVEGFPDKRRPQSEPGEP